MCRTVSAVHGRSRMTVVRRKKTNGIDRPVVPARVTWRSSLLMLSGVLKRYERESLMAKLKKRILKK